MGCCTLHRQPRVGKEAVIRCTGLPPSAPVSVWSMGLPHCAWVSVAAVWAWIWPLPGMSCRAGMGWDGSSPAVWTHSLEAVLFVSGITGTWSAWACPLSLQAPQPQSVLQTGGTFSSRSHSLLTFGWAAAGKELLMQLKFPLEPEPQTSSQACPCTPGLSPPW